MSNLFFFLIHLDIIDNCKLVTEECRQKLLQLRNKYYPIEIDPQLTMEEKYPFMVEWWVVKDFLIYEPDGPDFDHHFPFNAAWSLNADFVSRYFKSHTLLVEQRLEKDKLPEVVRESDVALRYLQNINLNLFFFFLCVQRVQNQCNISFAVLLAEKALNSSLTASTNTMCLFSFSLLVWATSWKKSSFRPEFITQTSKSCQTSWTLMKM